mmetsp:Transcript_5102/g.7383  ORF Transcript_5102/g.7383 Transcript_5102/m.7383 type:complete len:120 (-) Transcript_5102:156-515(-)
MKYQGNYFHSEKNTAVLAYPKAVFTPDCTTEMMLDIVPVKNSNKEYIFNEEEVELVTEQMKEDYIKRLRVLNAAKAATITTTQHQLKVSETIQMKKLFPHAMILERATKGSIGYDISSS